jgi:hypothetical protein
MKAHSTAKPEHSHHHGSSDRGGHGHGQQATAAPDSRPEMGQQQGLLSLMAGSPKLQRKCACGAPSAAGGSCSACAAKSAAEGSQVLQKKLAIGATDDPLEREADRIADQVMVGPAQSPLSSAPPQIQRITGQVGGQMDTAPASVERVLASSGKPLEAGLRREMEQRFGHDFSGVRIHDDNLANISVRSLSARAFTAGQHIAFAAGSYVPATHQGQHLLAHELVHVVQQQASPVTLQRRNDPVLDADEKPAEGKLQAAPETRISFDDLEAREPRAAFEIKKLSAGYRGLINQVDSRLVAAKVYQRPMLESLLLHAAHPRILKAETEIERDGLHDSVHLSEWLEAVTAALGHLAPLLKAWAEARPGEARLAEGAEFTRAGLAETAQQLAASDFMRRGVSERERKAAATREQKRILGAVDYTRSMVERVWRPDLSDQEGRLYGTLLANQLVHTLKLDSAQVREVLDTLRAEDPELLKAVLFRGGTVLALTDEYHRISGLQAYRAEGEGFFSGAIRADRESRYANKPGQRRFSLVERAIAAAGFIAGAFQGIGDSIWGNMKGIVELFTPSFWSGLVDFFRNFLPRFIDSDDFRFELGQMMGQFSADEERRLATAEPAEYGRTFGQVFGMAITEIALSFIGLGFVLKAFNGSARLEKIAKPLVAIANRLAKTAIASKLIHFAQAVGEAINALSLRLRKLSMLPPDLTPNARLRRTLFEMEEAERKLQKSVQRAQELEQVARKALAAGDNESAQQRVQELAQAVDDVERQLGQQTPLSQKTRDAATEVNAARTGTGKVEPGPKAEAVPKVEGGGAAAPSVPKVDAEQLKKVGWVSDETIANFRKHPEQLKAWSESPEAARVLKHCHSPCFPQMDDKQIREFQKLVRELGQHDLSLEELGVDAGALSEKLKNSSQSEIDGILRDLDRRLQAELGADGRGSTEVLDEFEDAARKRQEFLPDDVDDPHPTVAQDRPDGDLFNTPQQEIDEAAEAAARGNTFNAEQEGRFRNNEVYVDAPPKDPPKPKKPAKPAASLKKPPKPKKPPMPKKPKRFIVDSYDPDLGVIVSRKFPKGQKLDVERGIKYIEELITKYPPGTLISYTPRNRELQLAGKVLKGNPVLLLPEVHGDIPEEVLAFAERVGVTIMDAEGKVYRPLLPH